MPELAGEGALIQNALRDLRIAWDAAGEGWQDSLRSELEQRELAALELRAREAAKALESLALLIAEAERACA